MGEKKVHSTNSTLTTTTTNMTESFNIMQLLYTIIKPMIQNPKRLETTFIEEAIGEILINAELQLRLEKERLIEHLAQYTVTQADKQALEIIYDYYIPSRTKFIDISPSIHPYVVETGMFRTESKIHIKTTVICVNLEFHIDDREPWNLRFDLREQGYVSRKRNVMGSFLIPFRTDIGLLFLINGESSCNRIIIETSGEQAWLLKKRGPAIQILGNSFSVSCSAGVKVIYKDLEQEVKELVQQLTDVSYKWKNIYSTLKKLKGYLSCDFANDQFCILHRKWGLEEYIVEVLEDNSEDDYAKNSKKILSELRKLLGGNAYPQEIQSKTQLSDTLMSELQEIILRYNTFVSRKSYCNMIQHEHISKELGKNIGFHLIERAWGNSSDLMQVCFIIRMTFLWMESFTSFLEELAKFVEKGGLKEQNMRFMCLHKIRNDWEFLSTGFITQRIQETVIVLDVCERLHNLSGQQSKYYSSLCELAFHLFPETKQELEASLTAQQLLQIDLYSM